MSNNQKSPTTKKLQRVPPPTLFSPPQNASHGSLPGAMAAIPPPVITSPASAINPTTPRSSLIQRRPSRIVPRIGGGPSTLDDESPGGLRRPSMPLQHLDSERRRQADRTDALWAEMQSTLEEVELSAVNGTHAFGPEHSQALEGLRQAQIQLAQAWARSEAEEAVESADKESKGLSGPGGRGLGTGGILGSEGKSAGTDGAGGSTGAGGSIRPGSSGAGGAYERVGNKSEEETEADIILARKRREANDVYFQRVNEGVLDVVAKLEGVATAMAAVEQESRDIWGVNESSATSIIQG